MLGLCQCAPAKQAQLDVSGSVREIDVPTAELKLASRSSRLICIPAYEFSDLYGTYLVFDVDGVRISPELSANRRVRIINGLDVSDGIVIVGKKPVSISIPLDSFTQSQKDIGKVIQKIEFSDCEDFINRKYITRNISIELKSEKHILR